MKQQAQLTLLSGMKVLQLFNASDSPGGLVKNGAECWAPP